MSRRWAFTAMLHFKDGAGSIGCCDARATREEASAAAKAWLTSHCDKTARHYYYLWPYYSIELRDTQGGPVKSWLQS